MTGTKIAFFYKGCPFPAQSGLQRRVLEIISGFKELGGEVTLFSTQVYSETPWTAERIEWLKQHGATDVKVYNETPTDYIFRRLIAKFDHIRGRNTSLFSAIYSPPGARRWLAKHMRALSPAVTVMVYGMWDGMLANARGLAGVRVIDTIDLVSINAQMRRALGRTAKVTAEGWDTFDDAALDDRFYEGFDLVPARKEFEIYDRYDYTIAISESEAGIIRAQTRKTQVVYLPMTEAVRPADNDYDGAALFTMGDNPYNRQAVHYFVSRVLPTVILYAPEFHLTVTGAGRVSLPPHPNVFQAGFVPDLKDVYRHARFLVCPVFGGTGQLIKVVEAMAYGLPVIILQAAAGRAKIEHGVDGFIARNATEFAEFVVTLWRDPKLCRRMGEAARQSVRRHFSRERLYETLKTLLPRDRVAAINP